MSLRYERKFVVETSDVFYVENIIRLNKALFSEVYHERIVNNIYLDSFSKKSYSDNVVGISNRVKVRIRWYGSLTGLISHPKLELKIKHGELGHKRTFDLKAFVFDSTISSDSIRSALLKSDLPKDVVELIQSLEISLINRYSRKYFLSADNHFRVTIDFNQQYYSLSFGDYLFDDSNDGRVVVELKYDSIHGSKAHFISNQFPFRLSKNSKYVQGVDVTL